MYQAWCPVRQIAWVRVQGANCKGIECQIMGSLTATAELHGGHDTGVWKGLH